MTFAKTGTGYSTFLFRNVIAVLFFCGTTAPVIAQDTVVAKRSAGKEEPLISWVCQYPPLTGKHRKRPKAGFVDFVFGKQVSSEMSKPVALLAESPDTMWVLDQGNGVIYRVRKKTGEIAHYRNKEYKSFASLVATCSLPGNRILFTESYLNKIFLFSPDKKALSVLNDTLTLDRPTGIAWSSATKEIWVVETNAHRISVLNEQGQLIRRFGQRGTGPGEFNFPTSVWIDDSGKAFVVDAMNFRVQTFSKEGTFEGMFGQIGDATGFFARPKGIATDSKGNIYIADALFNTVQIFDQSGRFLYNFGEQGQGEGQFWMPAGIFIDRHDNIYVADTYNSRVQVFHNNYTEQ
jgi:DNA-binding beta-propeller fold protein YncE